MTLYFYFDADGDKRGPYKGQTLQTLIERGLIERNTPMETDTGEKTTAGQILDLDISRASVSHSARTTSEAGFLDIGFTRFITNAWISIIWVIVIIAHVLAAVAIGVRVAAMNNDAPMMYLLALLVLPISLLFSRMSLELTIRLVP